MGTNNIKNFLFLGLGVQVDFEFDEECDCTYCATALKRLCTLENRGVVFYQRGENILTEMPDFLKEQDVFEYLVYGKEWMS